MVSQARILIIGAGEAGVAAAGALRDGGYSGQVLLANAEASLPYERPPLSKEVLLGDAAEPKLIQPEDWYAQNDIQLLNAAYVTDIDAQRHSAVIRKDGQQQHILYDQLLFATGASPRKLPDFGDDVVYLRTREDGANLHDQLHAAERVLVIGGGVIGLEVASSARALGKQVTVVDLATRLMARAVSPDISNILLALHRQAGVDVILGAGTVSRSPTGVLLADGRAIDADLIIAGIGVAPNTELAATAGCRIENGIVVDHCGRTSVEDLYAAGDVAAFPHPTFERAMRVEAWQHAGRHGAHVARAMMGIEDGYCEIPWFWTDQHGTNIQVAGSAEGTDRIVWRGPTDRGTAFHFAGNRLLAATTINNGRDIRPSTKLIAAGWCGDPATLIDESRPLGKLAAELIARDEPAPADA